MLPIQNMLVPRLKCLRRQFCETKASHVCAMDEMLENRFFGTKLNHVCAMDKILEGGIVEPMQVIFVTRNKW